MDYDKAMAWAAVLRTDEFEQGMGNLTSRSQNKDRDCCLGVECKLAIKDGLHLDVVEMPNGTVYYNGRGDFLPLKVLEWGDFKDFDTGFNIEVFEPTGEYSETIRYSLSSLNDAGLTFSQIADLIERFWDQL